MNIRQFFQSFQTSWEPIKSRGTTAFERLKLGMMKNIQSQFLGNSNKETVRHKKLPEMLSRI